MSGDAPSWRVELAAAGAAGIENSVSPHSVRATGIAAFLENGGMQEIAQRIAAYAGSRTTRLYDRRAKGLSRAKSSGFDLIDGAFAPQPEWRADRV